MMMSKTIPDHALVLFAHGARDPRWAEPLVRLQQLIEAEVSGSVSVHQAFLEIMSPDLPNLIAQLAAKNYQRVTVVPIFLGQGGHVRRDLPQLISQLQASYPAITFSLTSAIGESDQVLRAIASVCMNQLSGSVL